MGRGKENIATHDKEEKPERPEMQNTGDEAQKGGREDREPLCKTKGGCDGLGVSYERGGPVSGKTLQIRCRGRAEDDKRAESGKQTGTEGNVYYMRRHLPVGGSDLLEGDCFSISPRQSSNTLAVQWGR